MVCGIKYQVKFVSELGPNGNDWEGSTDFGQTTIFILKGRSAERQLEVFYHELAHACAEDSGYRHLAASKKFHNAFPEHERDEIMVRVFARAYISALMSCGLLVREPS